MPGHRLRIGEHGDISYRDRGEKVTASLYYRGHDGRRRRIEATAASRTAARRRALEVLAERMSAGVGTGYTATTTFGEVASDWLRQLDELVEAGRRSPSTVALYRHALERHVLPGVGTLRLNELTPASTTSCTSSGARRGTRPRSSAGRSSPASVELLFDETVSE